jgi:CHASE3 domain sensor protein
MRRSPGLKKSVAGFVIVMFSFLSVVVAPLQAAMVGTADILQQQDNAMARQKVAAFLERQDVAGYLSSLGVAPDEAKARVDAMTDEEIATLADKIDQLPAGGDAIGFLVVVALVTFIVLMITDMMGVTDVFTFIKKR